MRRAVVLSLLLFAACRREYAPPAPVILISIDTLRADHLPVYGYGGVETPAIDAFRRDAVLFSRAWSHTPLTVPSHGTILSGMLPAHHALRDNTGFVFKGRTLASILRERGYATGAAVSAFVLRGESGLRDGFDAYDDRIDAGGEKSLGAVQRRGDETIAIAQSWIDDHRSKPFFYFLHLYEPHAPYEPPQPFRSHYSNAYDGEIAAADALLGRFLDHLKEQGLYDSALIVVLSDHGEGLGEHGEDEHGIFLYREALSVPLLVKLPGNALAGESSRENAGLADVAPTILSILGIPLPRFDGHARLSARAVLPAPALPIYSETYYPRFHFGWSDLHSLVDGDEHYIRAPREELYDLRLDPRETKNVIDERRRRFVALRTAIAPLVVEPAAPAAVSVEDAKKLAALGYLGSTVQTSGPRPDPKDKTRTFRALQDAFRFYRNHEDEKALAAFDSLLKSEPEIVDLWDVRSKVLFRLGRTREGIDSAKEALRRNPSATNLATDLANELLLAGDLGAAQQHAELALASEPAKAHEVLARIALQRNDLSVAQREAQLAGESEAAKYTRALVAQKQGRFEDVLRLTSNHALRADALARLGRNGEAEGEFRAAIRTDPAQWRGLVVLLVSEGRVDEASNEIRRWAATAPARQTYAQIAETLHVLGDEEGAKYWRARAR
jgi:arylsulfatase A-like enzyme/Tfp pilus assembly protein PilF